MANKFDHLTATERAAAPTTPATGDWRLYFKSDGLYVVDDAGTEVGPLSTGVGSSPTFKGARVSRTNTLSIPHATNTNITWETEDYDEGGYVDLASANNLIQVPTGEAGYYAMRGCAPWGAFTTTSGQSCETHLKVAGNASHPNQTFSQARDGNAGNGLAQPVTAVAYLEEGAYAYLQVRQSSGAARNIDPSFTTCYLELHKLA